MSEQASPLRTASDRDFARAVLDVVVPAHNEEVDLELSVRWLHSYLTEQLPYPFRITIADNASTDATARWWASRPSRRGRQDRCGGGVVAGLAGGVGSVQRNGRLVQGERVSVTAVTASA
jgi:hypothetical protein